MTQFRKFFLEFPRAMLYNNTAMPVCWNGRRGGLKIRWGNTRVGSSPTTGTMSNVHNDNEHSVDRSNRKIAPVFVYPALRVMYSTATPCRVSIVTLDGKEATSGISSTPMKL